MHQILEEVPGAAYRRNAHRARYGWRDVVNAFSVETTPSAQPADMAVPCADTGDSQDGRNPEVQNKFNQVERSWACLLIYPAQLRQLFEYLIELTKPG